MITKFKIFESNESIWSEITSNFEDEDDHVIYIDAYKTHTSEIARVIATINIKTGEVTYKDKRAKTDSYAQEVIQEVIADILPERRRDIEIEKYNL